MSEQPGRDVGGPGQTGGGAEKPPGRPGDGTRLPTEQAKEWHRALLSVYYYGRQNQGTLGRHAPPMGVRSLAYAIDVLARAPVGPVRLALADLCRTRAPQPTSRTLKLAMSTLATTYQKHLRRLIPDLQGTRLDLPTAFEDIFKERGSLDPEAAYARAIGVMLQHEQSRIPANQRPALQTYSVSSS
ncbi:MAG TPA: hypothetical protein VKZ18_12450 [Polyangia bacterium]|nr:hypothetical protein [Polyangia bacterium]